ncbi:hypothetical protein [Candidatus Magnetaquiglobus chichijimensis]|uniref:hypothetical protein n=1 Tax=Candidatus Magnetaquiglobus chichijimensis TaxID=3141448 RepID=UPI003B97443C
MEVLPWQDVPVNLAGALRERAPMVFFRGYYTLRILAVKRFSRFLAYILRNLHAGGSPSSPQHASWRALQKKGFCALLLIVKARKRQKKRPKGVALGSHLQGAMAPWTPQMQGA